MALELTPSQPFVSMVNQWEIIAKEFTSEVDSSWKDVAHIQNMLLHICLFTDFACFKAI